MASKYYYYVTWNDEKPGPGVFPIDKDGKYLYPDRVAELVGQDLRSARGLRRELIGDGIQQDLILRFNRKTHKFVGVVK
ncbi:hypothetical protein [Pseudomonas phage K4]|nr:hypothetical protein [Pseudomonas phage K4]